MSELFKDRVKKTEYPQMISSLLKALEENNREMALKELLLSTKTPEIYKDHGKYKLGEHLEAPCKRITATSADGEVRETEKRICRCLAFRGAGKSDCTKCPFLEQKKAVRPGGNVRVVDYEVPAFYYGEGIGEIDLVIDLDGVRYAVEVKPKKSSEPVLRMVAEILTYTLGYPPEEYRPAIAFYAGSAQEREYHRLMADNTGFRELLKRAGITVFTLEKTGEQLIISGLGDELPEPGKAAKKKKKK